jgi:hypothetical protein
MRKGRRYPEVMKPGPAAQDGGDAPAPPAIEPGWQPIIPSVREHLPSVVWGAVLPLGIYFVVRSHVQTDTQALIVAGSFSAAWVLIQFVRQRRVDLVGVIVLSGFAVGVASAELMGGNSYFLKVRDAFFTAIFGAVCIVTVFTHRRPALFYVGRYLTAGQDPAKVAAYDGLHEVPTGRHTFRVLSVVWGIGLIVEAVARMALAEALPTGTFLAVSPFVTATVIGSLFAFTVIFVRRSQLETLLAGPAMTPAPGPADGEPDPQLPPPEARG